MDFVTHITLSATTSAAQQQATAATTSVGRTSESGQRTGGHLLETTDGSTAASVGGGRVIATAKGVPGPRRRRLAMTRSCRRRATRFEGRGDANRRRVGGPAHATTAAAVVVDVMVVAAAAWRKGRRGLFEALVGEGWTIVSVAPVLVTAVESTALTAVARDGSRTDRRRALTSRQSLRGELLTEEFALLQELLVFGVGFRQFLLCRFVAAVQFRNHLLRLEALRARRLMRLRQLGLQAIHLCLVFRRRSSVLVVVGDKLLHHELRRLSGTLLEFQRLEAGVHVGEIRRARRVLALGKYLLESDSDLRGGIRRGFGDAKFHKIFGGEHLSTGRTLGRFLEVIVDAICDAVSLRVSIRTKGIMFRSIRRYVPSQNRQLHEQTYSVVAKGLLQRLQETQAEELTRFPPPPPPLRDVREER